VTAPFSLVGDLPESSLVIEASAGTGKTFTLAGLATRFVAERDVRASELLIVTFTRAATAELRDRVRARFVDAADHLASLEAGGEGRRGAEEDPLLAHLGGLPDRGRARANLERAVTEFDAATISTIHGFATQVLGLLGLTDGDGDGLVEDTDQLTLAVCADVLASEAASGVHADLLPTYHALTGATQVVLGRPGLVLEPDAAAAGPALMQQAVVLRRMVERCVDGVRTQRSRLGHRSFGDVLTMLRDELKGDRGEVAAELVRSRFRAALIDEFQDTDPIQWDIFEALFGRPGADGTRADLVLVGDPKQAIYAFRGADVHTYVRAVEAQPNSASLTTNWRSDGAALDAVGALFDGATFGSSKIAFHPVGPAPDHRDRRLRHTDGGTRPGLVVRVRSNRDIDTTRDKVNGEPAVQVTAARREIFLDLAGSLVDLLDDGWIPDADHADPGGPDGHRRVRPSDIAVLVKSASDAESVRKVLGEHQIPSVLARGRSVLESAAAVQWRWLLSALQRPTDHHRARTFALSWFEGHDVDWLDQADDEAIAAIQERLWTWSNVLQTNGIEAFLRRVFADTGVVARLLATGDGDRDVTDLEHIAELFRTDRPAGRTSIAGLLAALDDGDEGTVKVNPNAEFEGDGSSRRVASEADAVQIMTVWVAKGLEFPIVCCPTMWTQGRVGDPTIYLDDEGERRYDLLKQPWPDKASSVERAGRSAAERDGEAMRLLYVALTRAQHQTLVWWTRVKASNKTALGRVLFGRRLDGSFDPDVLPDDLGAVASDAVVPPEDRVVACLDGIAARANAPWPVDEPAMDAVDIGMVTAAPRWSPPVVEVDPPDLTVARLERVPNRVLGRWSFSSISSRAGDVHDNVDEPGGSGPTVDDADAADHGDLLDPFDGLDERDAGDGAADGPGTAGDARSAPTGDAVLDRFEDADVSPLAPLPAGTGFGLLVHAIYEHVDFADKALADAIVDRLGRELAWRTISLTPALLPDATELDGRRRLVAGIVASIETPLGTDLDDRPLRSFGRADRLDELDFELHLASASHPVTDRDLGRVLLAHLPADDPFRPWAERVAEGVFDVDLAGHLTGSIDLILRVRTEGRPDRYVIVDYKTNRLHDPTGAPAPGDYGPDRLVDEMAHAHYPLQALLYSVALHRYLRWRLADYDPATHLGGARYLFVRGMTGPDPIRTDGIPDGVARWDLPPAAVVAVSDLLAGVATVDPIVDPPADSATVVTEVPVDAAWRHDPGRAEQSSLFDTEDLS
jgi:exodeoxyribonuclease V beta subunit